MKKKLMLLVVSLFAGISMLTAQTSTVQGVVISGEDGEPVIGASVMVTGSTSQGTVTDADGKFTIPNVSSDAKTLTVSFIGMQTQEVAIKSGVMTITLRADTELLEEVVVTAYGTTTRESFTGSAATVKADKLNSLQSSNVTGALAGKVAGVQTNTTTGQPGASNPTIRIRGIGSISAGNSPLIIVDGVPFDGDLNNINNQDVESMTVLKDAASNALYGARGANGVIMITTKKGDKGRARVTVDAKWGSNSRAVQDYNMISNPAQYYEVYYQGLKNYYLNTLGYSDANAHVAAATNLTSTGDYGLGYNVYAVPTGQYLIGDNGKLNPNATLGNIVDYKGFSYLLRPDNWLDNVYRTSLRQEYNVSATAGSNDASFYASFNYLANDGITDNSDFNRITGRLKADWQIKPWLKVGANMDYAHFDGKLMSEDGSSASSGNLLAIATQVAPIYPLFIRDGDGNIRYDSNGIMRYDFGNGDNGGGSRPFLNNTNAVFANIYDTNSYEGNAVNAVGFFEVRFLKDFKFTSTNSVYVLENRSTQVTNPYYGGYATSNGIVSKAHTRTLSYNYQQLLNYKRDFNDHSVEVMVGHEAYRTKGYALSAYKSNMFDPSNHELNGAVTDGSPASYTTDYNTEGFFGRAQYDYKDTYFASGSYRRDGSSRFHPDHRWGNFWSLSGAWMLSKEEWFEVDWLNELKLKASYGSQGNDNIGNYRYTNTYTLVVSSGRPAVVPVSTKGNKEITWETNGNFNVGLEFALFDSRLTGSVDYFNRKTTDMLFTFPLPVSYGYTSYYANIGDMLNNGVEVDLEGQIIKNNDMEWSVNANITYYKNKISYLPEERKSMTVDGVSGFSSGNYFYGEGAPLYTFHMPRYAGVNEKGETLFYKNVTDEQGNTTLETTTSSSEASDYLCGTALPDAYGGFGTTFKYKGFDLSLDFVYQLGGQVYDGDYASMMSSPMTSSKGRAIHADILNSWTPDNTSSNIPRYQFNDQFTAATSDRFLIDASYLSLQNIMAGYTLPSRLCRTIGLEKLRVYVACDNVWLWSKRQGLDPRQSISGSVTNSYYAPIRTISGGVTLTF